MKNFKINSDQLLKLLEPLNSVISDGHMIPILQCVKIEIYQKKIYVTGDNAEINCVNFEKIKCDETITFCINFQMLLNVLKSIKNQEVEFKLKETIVYILHSKGDFKIPIVNSNEFPLIKKEVFKKSATIDGKQLKSSLKVANKFILNSELEAVSNVCISIGKKIIIRSTNKVCLFEERIEGKGDEQVILISGKSSSSLLGLVESEEVLLRYNSDKIYLQFSNREITIVQQQGDFPLKMFNTIIETIDSAELLSVDFNEFNTSLKRTSTLSNKEKSYQVKVNIDKSSVKVSCENSLTESKAEETIGGNFFKEKEVGYNSKFLIEILSVFDEKSRFYLNETNCFCIKSKKKKGLIAPVLLNKN